MANHGRRATSSKPKWLRSINREREPNHLGPALFPATTSTQPLHSNHSHVQPRYHPSVPQHEPEPPVSAHQTISSSSPAPADDNSVACDVKRKAPNVALRDEEQRNRHDPRRVATSLKGRGGTGASGVCISLDEGANIMKEATMALKNSKRRATSSGCESHSNRARTAAIDSDDGEPFHFLSPSYAVLIICRATDTETLLSWSRKVGAAPPLAAQSGPPRNQKRIETDSAMDGITQAQNDMDSPEGCDFSLGIRDENTPSGKVLGMPGPATLDEAMRPLQECVQPVLGGTQDQSPPSVPERTAYSSECREVDMDVAHELFPPPIPHELSTASHGYTSNLENSPALGSVGTQGTALYSLRRTFDSLIYTILDDTSDCDVPLAVLALRKRKRRRAPSVEKPRRRTKAKGKGKADRCDFVDVDASREDNALGG